MSYGIELELLEFDARVVDYLEFGEYKYIWVLRLDVILKTLSH